MHSFNHKKIIIFGAGYEGERSKFILSQIGYGDRVVAFADNNPQNWGEILKGVPIISINELREKYYDEIILIATCKYAPDIYGQLLEYGFQRQLIFYPRGGRFVAGADQQYFDLPYLSKQKGEVFIDAGAYDGMSSVEFAQWCNNEYEAIYCFEPNFRCKDKCEKTLTEYQLQNTYFINKGTWREEKILRFAADDGAGSSFQKNGKYQVSVTSIDQILLGNKATFIKMDVEGSELASLEGAKETIRKWHPKLAICIYHKPEDIFEIPNYILELNPDYKLFIRHYSSYLWETVLYAI